jgi:Effector protein
VARKRIIPFALAAAPETSMPWDYDQYVNYIKKLAPPAELSALLKAPSTPFVPKDGKRKGKATKIFATYYSMPDWLDIFSLQNHLQKTPIEHMIKDYRHTAEKHQKQVIDCLDMINVFSSGKALIEEVDSTRYWVRIMPFYHFFRTMPHMNYDNATPWALRPGETLSHISDGTLEDFQDEYEKGAVVRNDDNEPASGEGPGTGKGANVALFFSAQTWKDMSDKRGAGHRPDEVLYHELVHVSRQVRGKMTRLPVEGKGFPNIEEYFATVITNIYMSDKLETRLRGYYAPDFLRQEYRHWKINGEEIALIIDPLPNDWDLMQDPDAFYDNPDNLSISPRQLMGIFRVKQPSFYIALAHLPQGRPLFNPVGQHFRETAAAKAPAVRPASILRSH